MYRQYVLEDWLTISLGNGFVPIQCHEEQSSVKFSTIRPSIHPNYIMAGHAIVVVKDITLLFYHGNAVILTLW